MMRCHSPDVSSCPIVLAVQDNVNVHDDAIHVGWGACVIIDRWPLSLDDEALYPHPRC